MSKFKNWNDVKKELDFTPEEIEEMELEKQIIKAKKLHPNLLPLKSRIHPPCRSVRISSLPRRKLPKKSKCPRKAQTIPK